MIVVVVDIFRQLFLEFFDGSEDLVVEELGLEQAKKGFDHTVVIAIAFPGHTLVDAMIVQQLAIRFHLVMPALIRMQDQISMLRNYMERFLQHIDDQSKVWRMRERITNDLAIEEVEDRRQIERLTKQLELGDIGGPFHIGLGCFEVALQQVGCQPPNFSTVGVIFLPSQPTCQTLLRHQFYDQFVVGWIASLVKCQRDPAIPIATFMLATDLAYLKAFRGVFLLA